MTISTLPAAPNRATMSDEEFSAAADAFVASLQTLAAEINIATAAMNFNSTNDTSTSSVAIGTGSKSLTVSTGKSFVGGMYLVIADAAAPSTNSMFCQVTSYNAGTGALVVNVISVLGSGTKTSWLISQSQPGTSGAQVVAALGANTFTGVQNMAAGAAIASASTINLTTATGNIVHVTGTTQINAVTLGAGMWREVIFDSVLTLAHNATTHNLNANGQNIVTAAGDRCWYYSDGTTVYGHVVKANGSAPGNAAVAARQAVQYGPLTAAGQPDLIPQSQVGNTLAAGVTLKGTTAPFFASVGAGFNADGSPKNINFVSAADINSGALAASVTNYLWLDAATGAVGVVSVADAFQFGGTIPVTANQYTYDYANHIMYLGNGTTASQSNRLIVAEVDTNATVVTAIRVRAYNGKYDSGWTNTLVAAAGNYTKNHNMGTQEIDVHEVVECITAEDGWAVGDQEIDPMGSSTNWPYKPALVIKKNTVSVKRPTTYAYFHTIVTSGAGGGKTAANWKYKITAERKF